MQIHSSAFRTASVGTNIIVGKSQTRFRPCRLPPLWRTWSQNQPLSESASGHVVRQSIWWSYRRRTSVTTVYPASSTATAVERDGYGFGIDASLVCNGSWASSASIGRSYLLQVRRKGTLRQQVHERCVSLSVTIDQYDSGNARPRTRKRKGTTANATATTASIRRSKSRRDDALR